jgi:hypothetical protein
MELPTNKNKVFFIIKFYVDENIDSLGWEESMYGLAADR